jgi:hypothetical protein
VLHHQYSDSAARDHIEGGTIGDNESRDSRTQRAEFLFEYDPYRTLLPERSSSKLHLASPNGPVRERLATVGAAMTRRAIRALLR